MLNTFDATWFDMKWKPTIDTPEWKKAITFYVNLMKADGPPGASANGFNENLTLFASGKAAMWIEPLREAVRYTTRLNLKIGANDLRRKGSVSNS